MKKTFLVVTSRGGDLNWQSAHDSQDEANTALQEAIEDLETDDVAYVQEVYGFKHNI